MTGLWISLVRCVTWFIEWKILFELSKKKTVVDKFLIHNFMNLIQSYDISQDIWGKIFSSLAAFVSLHQSHSPLRFLCELLFVVSTTDGVGNMFSTFKQPGLVFTSTAKLQTPHSNSNSGNKLQQRDTILLKRIIYAPKTYHFWFLPFLVLVYSGFPRCVCSGGY